jgi:hypothetical protein
LAFRDPSRRGRRPPLRMTKARSLRLPSRWHGNRRVPLAVGMARGGNAQGTNGPAGRLTTPGSLTAGSLPLCHPDASEARRKDLDTFACHDSWMRPLSCSSAAALPIGGGGGADGRGTLTFRDPSRRGPRPPLRMTKGGEGMRATRMAGRPIDNTWFI